MNVTKIQQKNDGRNHHKGDKKGRPKKGQKMNSLQEPKKKGRELVSLVVGGYLTHGPSNVTCMQIVRVDLISTKQTMVHCF
jgi:hypothetical protein